MHSHPLLIETEAVIADLRRDIEPLRKSAISYLFSAAVALTIPCWNLPLIKALPTDLLFTGMSMTAFSITINRAKQLQPLDAELRRQKAHLEHLNSQILGMKKLIVQKQSEQTGMLLTGMVGGNSDSGSSIPDWYDWRCRAIDSVLKAMSVPARIKGVLASEKTVRYVFERTQDVTYKSLLSLLQSDSLKLELQIGCRISDYKVHAADGMMYLEMPHPLMVSGTASQQQDVIQKTIDVDVVAQPLIQQESTQTKEQQISSDAQLNLDFSSSVGVVVPQREEKSNIPEVGTPNTSIVWLNDPSVLFGNGYRELSVEQRKHLLWNELTKEENSWILLLLEPANLLVKGGQGAGKTAFMGFVGLLRVLFLGHTFEVCDPHAHQNRQNWEGCEVYGKYYLIKNRIIEYFKRTKTKTLESPKNTVLFDEYTNYGDRITLSPDDHKILADLEVPTREIAGALTYSALSDARKANEFIMMGGHADTKDALGGGTRSGSHQMKEEALLTVTLHFNRPPDRFGKPTPAFRGTAKSFHYDDMGKPMQIPVEWQPWMNPRFMKALFPELPPAVFYGVPEAEFSVVPDSVQTVQKTAPKPTTSEASNSQWDEEYEEDHWIDPDDELQLANLGQTVPKNHANRMKLIFQFLETWKKELGAETLIEEQIEQVLHRFYPELRKDYPDYPLTEACVRVLKARLNL
jgi:hypothetical protein